MKKPYSLRGTVELFAKEKGWHYVRVPTRMSKPLGPLADRGVIAISATVGDTTWDTSLLPMGDDTHFIALPAKVRKKECLELGGDVALRFTLRTR